jgi:hypothetical protein
VLTGTRAAPPPACASGAAGPSQAWSCGSALRAHSTGGAEGPAAGRRRPTQAARAGAQAQALTPGALLLREACYRALGEGFSHPALASRVDFAAWYSSELRPMLAARAR